MTAKAVTARARRRNPRTRKGSPTAPHVSSPLLGLGYPLVAGTLAIVLLALYFYPYAENGPFMAATRSYLATYAKVVGGVLAMFNSQVVVRGTTIHGPLFSMQIVKTCDAMEVNILLLAALAAFPMRLMRRLLAVFAALVVLAATNLVRLCILYWIGVHAPRWFDRVHQTVAPIFMVAAALAIFIVAIRQPKCSPAAVDAKR